MADGSPATPPVATPPATPPAGPWYSGYSGVDEEMVGTWTNRGLHTKDPKDVAVAMTKAAIEAQRFVGVPANELLRLPKEAGDPAWAGIWQRLGKPVESKGYDFSGIKFKDGTAIDAKFSDAAREWAFRNHLPAEAAKSMVGEFTKFLDSAEEGETAEHTAKLAEQKLALKTNWGANYAPNEFIARQAAIKMGIEPDTLQAAENNFGFDKVMEMLRRIGVAIGEDKYVAGTQLSGNKVMTVESAQARKNELKADQAWVTRFTNGDAEARREMKALDIIISGVAA